MRKKNLLKVSILAPIAFLMIAVGVDALWIEPDWLEVVRTTIPSKRIPSEFEGYQVAQLSDLHVSDDRSVARLHKAIDEIMAIKPDLIVLTGDFITMGVFRKEDELTAELSRLSAPDGVYAVRGNHDWWINVERVTAAIERSGVKLLNNQNIKIQRAGADLYLAGVDDFWEAKADLGTAMDGIPSDAGAILLAHEPDFAVNASQDRRIFLQLSGHSHGGQVQLPFIGPIFTPRMAKIYKVGLYTVDDMQLYVNRGTGLIFPSVRFLSRPEVAIFTLSNR